MDASFLVAVGIGLALLSVMTVFRLSAVGVANRRVAVAVAELWIAVGLWVALLTSVLSHGGRTPAPARSTAWLADLMALLRSMTPGERMLALANLCVAAALVVHFMWSVRRLRPHRAKS